MERKKKTGVEIKDSARIEHVRNGPPTGPVERPHTAEYHEDTETVEKIENLQRKLKPAPDPQISESLQLLDFKALSPKQKEVLQEVIDPARLGLCFPYDLSKEAADLFYKEHPITFGEAVREWWNFREHDRSEERDLRHLFSDYHIERVYYPGSGADRVPRDAIGRDRIIHLHRPDLHGPGFFKDRKGRTTEEQDIEIDGDFRCSPLKSESVDCVLIRGIPVHAAVEAIDDFLRVLQPGGFLVFQLGKNWHDSLLKRIFDRKLTFIKKHKGFYLYQKV